MNLFIFLTLLITVQCQFIDPYGIYQNYSNTYGIFYYSGIFCNSTKPCLSNNLTNPSNLTLTINQKYVYYQSEIIFDINVDTCDPITVTTDHVNYVEYSYDGLNWIHKTKGISYIEQMTGNIKIKISSSIQQTIRFSIYNYTSCYNISSGDSDEIFNKSIIGDSVLNYGLNTFGFSSIWYSTNDCDFDVITYYSSNDPLYNKYYNYSDLNSLTVRGSSRYLYDITLYVYPKDKTQVCNIDIHFSSLSTKSMYTTPTLIYNGIQVSQYLILNETYDLLWSGNLSLYGGASTELINYQIHNLNNSQVYSILNEYQLNTTYFKDLLILNGEYHDILITLDNTFNFTTNLNLNNVTVDLRVESIPINISVSDSVLIVNNNVSLDGLHFTGVNSIYLNNQTTINTNISNFSGTLNLTISNYTNGTIGIIKYQEHTGFFDNITINGVNECTKYHSNYTKSELIVVFEVDESCSGSVDESQMMYIIIGVAIFLVLIAIIIVVVIFKVNKLRRNVLPHRDRTLFIPSDVINQPVIESRHSPDRSNDEYTIRKNNSQTMFNDDGMISPKNSITDSQRHNLVNQGINQDNDQVNNQVNQSNNQFNNQPNFQPNFRVTTQVNIPLSGSGDVKRINE